MNAPFQPQLRRFMTRLSRLWGDTKTDPLDDTKTDPLLHTC